MPGGSCATTSPSELPSSLPSRDRSGGGIQDGVELVTLALGLFGVGEVLAFGIAGAVLLTLDFPVAPFLLG